MLRMSGTALGLAGTVAVSFLPLSGASALTVTSFRGQGMESIYGSYALKGNCAAEPRLTIDEDGFTFTALGRTVKSTRIEYAASFMGPQYDGISLVFFPFPPLGGPTFGPVIMIVNDDEKPGVIRFEADVPKGQKADPFHAALTGASPFLLCKGTAPASAPPPAAASAARTASAPVAGTPVEWSTLPSLVGRYPGSYERENIDLFDKGAIAAALRQLLGGKASVLQTNLSVVAPLARQGSLYYVTGNAQHMGGEEQAYVLMDAARKAVQVGLWEKGKLTVYAPAAGRLAVPPEVAKMLAASPPETAVPLPGSPWEIVPAQGRAPIAYVDVAASPNITSFSLFCEGARPMMAVLLNKPATSPTTTVTWNFNGRLVNIPIGKANSAGTFWQANLTGSPLPGMLMQQKGSAMIRINGRGEGEVLLTNAPTALRTALRGCVKL